MEHFRLYISSWMVNSSRKGELAIGGTRHKHLIPGPYGSSRLLLFSTMRLSWLTFAARCDPKVISSADGSKGNDDYRGFIQAVFIRDGHSALHLSCPSTGHAIYGTVAMILLLSDRRVRIRCPQHLCSRLTSTHIYTKEHSNTSVMAGCSAGVSR